MTYANDSPSQILTRIRVRYYSGLAFEQLIPDAPYEISVFHQPPEPSTVPRELDSSIGEPAGSHLTAKADEMSMAWTSTWMVLTAVAACSRAAPDTSAADPAMVKTAMVSPVAAPPASAANASPPSPASDPVDAAQRWNAALAAHDTAALRRLYGPRILLYGTWLSRDGAVAAKASSFAASPDYRQSIDRVEVDDAEFPVRPVVTFHKSWSAAGQSYEVDASLVVTRERGTWKVVEESDAKTRDTESCSSLVTALVGSTKEASALLHGPLDPAHGHVANGLRYGEDAEDRSYSVGVFENHPDHLAMLEWFHVDPRTGAVTGEPPDGPPLRVDPMLASKVATDCWTEP